MRRPIDDPYLSSTNIVHVCPYLENNPESDRLVDTFYIRTLAGTNKKLIDILEFYELNNELPDELPHSAFIESIWDLVDQSIFKSV